MTDKERIKELLFGMANSDWCDNAAKRKIRNEILPLIDSLPEKPELTEFEKAIHRGFLCAGVKDVPTTIIKETAKDALAQIQKPADKVEPKFKVGDWIVYCGKACKITGLQNGIFTITNQDGSYFFNRVKSTTEPVFHLWTIQDAKNGDVLCCGNEISLYKHDIKNCTKQETTFGGFVYHCCYDGKRFITDSLYSLTEQDKMDIHPATKEQRDLLFQKMKENGYEWDAEKKELKKIEQKSAWSEEDREMLNKVIEDIVKLAGPYVCYHKDVDWLKSLKDRYTWKPSDEQIMALRWVLNHIPYDSHKEEISGLLEQLKKLRED